MKIATLTSKLSELHELVPLLRDLYFHGEVELLCLVNSEQEAACNALPTIHRRLREYVHPPLEPTAQLKEKALIDACRCALLEERPDLILWPTQTFLKGALNTVIRQCGIAEYQLGQCSEVDITDLLQNLRALDLATEPVVPGLVKAEPLLEPHWKKLGELLQTPCLLQTTPALEKLCREKFPQLEFDTKPQKESYPCGLSLLEASFSEKPRERFRTLTDLCHQCYSLEPVNSPLAGARWNLSYGMYDNEFALTRPELDLHGELPEKHLTEIWGVRSGAAGPQSPPHPDGIYPLFFSRWPQAQADWSEPYALPEGETLRIVFADSGNVAGSALHHADAVNRFTQSKAWALTGAPHPFIGPQKSNETNIFLNENPSQERVREILQQADCVVFFEDDDEESAAWPFPIKEYLQGVVKVHLYVGYRVHAKTPAMARSGRLILTPLPHLLKMYPEAKFYAGFPPYLREEEQEQPPLSASDGICRFLHTPSLPHWTTSRYPYHKDTEAFLRAARKLKDKYGDKVQFHQVGGWSHAEVVSARVACDVTFNQLRGFHGLSGDEAMMLGRVCVQSFDQHNINRHLEYWGLDVDFPWLSCHRENLVETFESLILDPERRQQIGQSSRHFMRKYFSPRKGILPLLFHCYRATRGV